MNDGPISSNEYLSDRLRAVQQHIASFEALLNDVRAVRARLGTLEESYASKIDLASAELDRVAAEHREVSLLVELGNANVKALTEARGQLERELSAARSAIDALPASVAELQAYIRKALDAGLTANLASVTEAINGERRRAEDRESTLSSFVRTQVSDAQRAYEGLSRRVDDADHELEGRIAAARTMLETAVSEERQKCEALQTALEVEHDARARFDRRTLVWLVVLAVVAIATLAGLALSRGVR